MLSEEDREAIYEQVAAAKLTASATNRASTALEIRNALLVQISEDAARLCEQIPLFILNYSTIANAMGATDEKLEDLHARQGVIDEKIKLILELERGQLNNIRDTKKRKEIEGRLNTAQALSLDAAAIRRRLAKQVSNLHYLQEGAAEYGGRVPLDMINQITDVQDLVQELQVELKQLERSES